MTMEKHDKIDDSEHVFGNLNEAKHACDTMHGLCAGVVREIGGTNYTLRKTGPPKHSDLELTRLLFNDPKLKLHGALGNDLRQAWIKLSKAAAAGDFKMSRAGTKGLRSDFRVVIPVSQDQFPDGKFKPLEIQDVLERNTTAFVKYCPGFYASYQKVPVPVKQRVGSNITKWVYEVDDKESQHFFAYKLTVEVMLKPLEYLFYSDDKHFESHLEKGSNHHTFTWPNNTPPDPSKLNSTRIFNFRTPDFVIPSTPGSYAIESKIADKLHNPYFQWNWWFEVTTGDKVTDAKVRDAYWKKKMNENVVKASIRRHAAMLKAKAAKARRNQEEFSNKMMDIQNQKKIAVPPDIKKLVKKIQNNYDKRNVEANQEEFDANNPAFQAKVGVIKLRDERDGLLKTTTKTKPKTMSVEYKRFHMKPKSKVPKP